MMLRDKLHMENWKKGDLGGTGREKNSYPTAKFKKQQPSIIVI